MKPFVAALLAVLTAMAAVAAEQEPATRGAPTERSLRQTLRDFLRQEPSAPPRHLSTAERAELRRQLMEYEYGRAPARPPTPPETR